MLIRAKENTFKIRFLDGGESSFIKGTPLFEILEFQRREKDKAIVLARVNNLIRSLHESLDENCVLEWIRIQSPEGRRSYQQSLCLVLIRATKELYPDAQLLIDHSLGKGLYCEFQNGLKLSHRKIRFIQERMREIIEANEAMLPQKMPRNKALALMKSNGEDPAWLDGNPELINLNLYQCGPVTDYLGYPLLPFTGRLNVFDLQYYRPGLILRPPDEHDLNVLAPRVRQKKLFQVFHEYGQWQSILGTKMAGEINKAVVSKSIFNTIKIAEGLHEKKFAQIADTITRKKRNLRIILIAGPSSSGKTTFAKRLGIQLRVNGLKPVAISLDDYFIDREKTPLDEKGQYDFESLRAINIQRFNEDLINLLDGRKVELPKYDFVRGKSIPGPVWQLKPDQPILIEGLHGLNNHLTEAIPKRNKYKIYVSALTQLNLTAHTRIPTSDVRLLRRLIRGQKFRGHDATDTLMQWRTVRLGEEKYIFPFQETADIIFNSSLTYELSVLRVLAKPLLETVSHNHIAYAEARRILHLLNCFLPVSPKVVPLNSILREFIGGSSFSY
ncbi:nucleoside kinase [bacterium]|nr:nucleoside kinase [bacterium]